MFAPVKLTLQTLLLMRAVEFNYEIKLVPDLAKYFEICVVIPEYCMETSVFEVLFQFLIFAIYYRNYL